MTDEHKPAMLWSDDDIARYAKTNELVWESRFEAAYWAAKWVRDRYQDELETQLAERTATAARVAALEARERELLNRFTDLTPGGSEFANDPQRCIDYAKNQARGYWGKLLAAKRVVKQQAARITELEAELARARDNMQRLALGGEAKND